MSFASFLEKTTTLNVVAIVGPLKEAARPLCKLGKGTYNLLRHRYGNMAVGSTLVAINAANLIEDLPGLITHPTPNLAVSVAFSALLGGMVAKTVFRVGKGVHVFDWKKNAEKTAILKACQEGNLQALEAYHEAHPDWNWKGSSPEGLKDARAPLFSPLESASYFAQWKVLDWLIDHGATVEVPGIQYFEELKSVADDEKAFMKKLEEFDVWSFTVFMGSAKSFQTLLERERANPNFTPMTGLYYLLKRADSGESNKMQDVVDIFEKCPWLCPPQEIRERLKEIEALDQNLWESDSVQPLLRSLISRAEQFELNNVLSTTTVKPTSSLKSKRL